MGKRYTNPDDRVPASWWVSLLLTGALMVSVVAAMAIHGDWCKSDLDWEEKWTAVVENRAIIVRRLATADHRIAFLETKLAESADETKGLLHRCEQTEEQRNKALAELHQCEEWIEQVEKRREREWQLRANRYDAQADAVDKALKATKAGK